MKESEAPQKPDLTVSPQRIVPNPFQPRRVFNEESLKELAESIKAHGILQPLIVRPQATVTSLSAGKGAGGLLSLPSSPRSR